MNMAQLPRPAVIAKGSRSATPPAPRHGSRLRVIRVYVGARRGFRQSAVILCALLLVTLMLEWRGLHHQHSLPIISNDVHIPGGQPLNNAANRIAAENVRGTISGPSRSLHNARIDFQDINISDDLWGTPNRTQYKPCIDRREDENRPGNETNGYIMLTSNGGLNQMRAGICDMVAVARIMNATLIIPSLDHKSFWADPSEFGDIFQLRHFIETLKYDVRIVETLPGSLQNVRPLMKTPVMRSQASYYEEKLLPLLKENKVLHFTHTNSRLVNNGLPNHIQRLRCRVNYRALQFAKPIKELGELLVKKVRRVAPYMALHLRYEKDMLSFTGCTHGLSLEEALELREMRYRVSHWKEKEIDGELKRLQGDCPLTPHETGILLKALGYPSSTPIYLVAGELFGNGSESLKKHFPNIISHSTLSSATDLAPLLRFKNRLAAVDYIVAMESNVFVYTYDGNMAKAVQGHRYFEGYRKTISPDRKNFIRLLDALESRLITWKDFRSEVVRVHANRTGLPHEREAGESPKLEVNFYANPFPDCICKEN